MYTPNRFEYKKPVKGSTVLVFLILLKCFFEYKPLQYALLKTYLESQPTINVYTFLRHIDRKEDEVRVQSARVRQQINTAVENLQVSTDLINLSNELGRWSERF